MDGKVDRISTSFFDFKTDNDKSQIALISIEISKHPHLQAELGWSGRQLHFSKFYCIGHLYMIK